MNNESPRELETVGFINHYSPTKKISADPYSTTGYEYDALEAFTSAVGRGLCASLRITDSNRWAIAKAEGNPLVETIRYMLLELDREARRLQRHADEFWSAATLLD